MLKILNLELLYEDVAEEYSEQKADIINDKIRKSNLGRVWENKYAISYIFKEENLEKLMEIIPKMKDMPIIDNIINFIEEMRTCLENFEFEKLTIKEEDVLEYIIDTYDDKKYEDRLMNSKNAINKEFDIIVKETTKTIVEEALIKIQKKLKEFIENK